MDAVESAPESPRILGPGQNLYTTPLVPWKLLGAQIFCTWVGTNQRHGWQPSLSRRLDRARMT